MSYDANAFEVSYFNPDGSVLSVEQLLLKFVVDRNYFFVANGRIDANQDIDSGAFLLFQIVYASRVNRKRKLGKSTHDIIKSVIDVKQVFVPECNRGQGTASRFMLKLIEVSKLLNMKIRPTCTFARDTFFPRNPILENEHLFIDPISLNSNDMKCATALWRKSKVKLWQIIEGELGKDGSKEPKVDVDVYSKEILIEIITFFQFASSYGDT